MPGLFSWKARLRGRKTPDIERGAVVNHGTITSNESSRRAVRFDDIVENAQDTTKRLKNTKNDSDIQISPVAPLASEEIEESREDRQVSSNCVSRTVPQYTNVPSRMPATENGPKIELPRRNLRPLGVVYLELNDEVKRALLPASIQSLDTVRALFLRSFPQLTSQYLSQPHVKVYIQEPSKGQLFYELDDLSDIKDQAVLKLREQISGYQSPQPIRFTDHPPVEYLSESEVEMMDYRGRVPHRYGSLRPSSALDGRIYGLSGQTKKLARPAMQPRFDGYYSQYSSDTSSQDARSGSVTPIIDKETRFRMETMERQLAGLSSLVHSALVSRGMSESSQKDMHDLRRQILALHPDINSTSDVPSSAEPSLPDSSSLSGDCQRQLLKLKRNASDMQNQLKSIKRAVQLNSQNTREILKTAFEKIQKCVEDGGSPKQKIENSLLNLKTDHLSRIGVLQKSLQSFEEDVENIRKLVLNTNRKLKMTEVEAFTQSLTKIGRNAAKLKTQFPDLRRELEKNIKLNMEKVVEEERFIKDEAVQIDECLRRCKTLANMMVTMKKLAMVQDPTISVYNKTRTEAPKVENDVHNQNFQPNESNGIKGPLVEGVKSPLQPSAIKNTEGFLREPEDRVVTTTAPTDNLFLREQVDEPPPVPPLPLNYNRPSTSSKNDMNVLDSILDELTNTVKKDQQSKSLTVTIQKAKSPIQTMEPIKNGPPKPPERYSTTDVRVRFTPSEVEEIQRRTMDTMSPIQESTFQTIYAQRANPQLTIPPPPSSTNMISPDNEGHIKPTRTTEEILEERQQKLREKQRQLHNQFEQLQQMCIPPKLT